MKRKAMILAVCALLFANGANAQSSNWQLQQNGFSSNMQNAFNGKNLYYSGTTTAPEYYAQSNNLPPISSSQQISLPPITSNNAPVVSSNGGKTTNRRKNTQNSSYSGQSVDLPPVTTLPVPSRTALPPLYSDTLMTAPLEEALSRVLGTNSKGFTGLSVTTSADTSKAGAFKMGFHSSWFDLEKIYNRTLATNESGERMDIPLFFNYAVTDDLEMVLNIPIVDYTAKSREIWRRDLSESGVGDMELGFKYKVFDNSEYQMRGAVGAVFKFPTGDDDKMLGTGKTDFEIFTAFSKNFEKIIGHLNLGYVMTGDPNNQFYPDGLADKFYYSIGIEYPHTQNVTVMAEIAGEDWGSCGMKVEAIPGIRYTPTENFAFEVAVPIAISNDQMWGYNYRLMCGLTTFFQ